MEQAAAARHDDRREKHEMRDPRRHELRGALDDETTHRVADEHRAGDAGERHRVGNRLTVRVDGRTPALVRATTVSRQIDGDDAMAARLEQRGQELPRPSAVTHAVHEDEFCGPTHDVILA